MPSKRIVQIINQAIASELEAYDFYYCMVEKVHDQEARDLYQCLAREELQHRDTLQSILEKGISNQFDIPEDLQLTGGEPMPRLSPEMKPRDALLLAIKKEEEAMKDYGVLAQLSKSADQKVMFENLVRMEQSHKIRLERLYQNLCQR